LILYVERLRIEQEHFARSEKRIALLGVVVIKELETGELDGL
jgi:hypothetical protein